MPADIRLWLMFSAVVCGPWFVAPTPARAEGWQYPLAVAVGNDGTIYVADRKLPGIWTLKDDKTAIFHQGSPKFRTPLNAIRCLLVTADGTLLAGDSATWDVFRVSPDGQKLTPLTGGQVAIPMAMAQNAAGDLFISDTQLQRVWKLPAAKLAPADEAAAVATSDGIAVTPAPPTAANAQTTPRPVELQEFLVINGPRGLAVDTEQQVWVLSVAAPQLQRISPDGREKKIVCDRQFEFPHQVLLGSDGTAYVSDGYAKAIWKVSRDGQSVVKWISGDPLLNPVGLAWRGENLLIIDPRADALFEASPDGKMKRLYPSAVP